MAFSRKHYVAIAKVLAKIEPLTARDGVVMEFIRIFKADNPAFRPSQFWHACNPEKAKPASMED